MAVLAYTLGVAAGLTGLEAGRLARAGTRVARLPLCRTRGRRALALAGVGVVLALLFALGGNAPAGERAQGLPRRAAAAAPAVAVAPAGAAVAVAAARLAIGAAAGATPLVAEAGAAGAAVSALLTGPEAISERRPRTEPREQGAENPAGHEP